MQRENSVTYIKVLAIAIIIASVLIPAEICAAEGQKSFKNILKIKPPEIIPLIKILRISNVRSSTFNISWVSPQYESCMVIYGADPNNLRNICYDDRGKGIKTRTHYVTIGDGGDGEAALKEKTAYYFYVTSGNRMYGNRMKLFRCVTGPTLSIPNPRTVYGRVYKKDRKTYADGAIVYVNIVDEDKTGGTGKSATLSSLVSSGYWHLNIDEARTEDLSGYFSYSMGKDSIAVFAEGGRDGEASMKINAGTKPPFPPLSLKIVPQKK